MGPAAYSCLHCAAAAQGSGLPLQAGRAACPAKSHTNQQSTQARRGPPPTPHPPHTHPTHLVVQDCRVAHPQPRHKGVAQEAARQLAARAVGACGADARAGWPHRRVVKLHQRRQVAQHVVVHAHDGQELAVGCSKVECHGGREGPDCRLGLSRTSWAAPTGRHTAAAVWDTGRVKMRAGLGCGMHWAGPSQRAPPRLSLCRVSTPSIQYRLPKPASQALHKGPGAGRAGMQRHGVAQRASARGCMHTAPALAQQPNQACIHRHAGMQACIHRRGARCPRCVRLPRRRPPHLEVSRPGTSNPIIDLRTCGTRRARGRG